MDFLEIEAEDGTIFKIYDFLFKISIFISSKTELTWKDLLVKIYFKFNSTQMLRELELKMELENQLFLDEKINLLK